MALLSSAGAAVTELPSDWEDSSAALDSRLARLAKLRQRNELLVERQLANLDASVGGRLNFASTNLLGRAKVGGQHPIPDL